MENSEHLINKTGINIQWETLELKEEIEIHEHEVDDIFIENSEIKDELFDEIVTSDSESYPEVVEEIQTEPKIHSLLSKDKSAVTKENNNQYAIGNSEEQLNNVEKHLTDVEVVQNKSAERVEDIQTLPQEPSLSSTDKSAVTKEKSNQEEIENLEEKLYNIEKDVIDEDVPKKKIPDIVDNYKSQNIGKLTSLPTN